MRNIPPHHKAWLENHPGETYKLFRCLDLGMCIHHIDGDHFNNHPNNLILMDSGDHARLHALAKKTLPEMANHANLTLYDGMTPGEIECSKSNYARKVPHWRMPRTDPFAV